MLEILFYIPSQPKEGLIKKVEAVILKFLARQLNFEVNSELNRFLRAKTNFSPTFKSDITRMKNQVKLGWIKKRPLRISPNSSSTAMKKSSEHWSNIFRIPSSLMLA